MRFWVLTGIDLKHFKCFDLLKLPLRPLTLLSGANASGKSSVLQALVLLHQTMTEHEWSHRLLLNGGAIRLGTVADVVDQRARRSCQIALRTDDNEIRWEFAGEPADMSMAVMRVWARLRKCGNVGRKAGTSVFRRIRQDGFVRWGTPMARVCIAWQFGI